MKSLSQQRFRTWPITAARSIEPQLREMGLRIPAKWIDGTSAKEKDDTDSRSKHPLSDALVSVGQAGRGGTGSFVSKDGLILTNWHVAYDAVRQASLLSSGIDYVEDGFVSQRREDEIRAPNYEVWITKSCVDVSDQILEVISQEKSDPLKRANRVRDITQEIAQKAQNSEGEGKRCDVQEMFPNESYVLFTYERLQDVRIVYVPPKALGNFGGDIDNFEWPRHTADFTLLRAYVGPDNKTAAEYSSDNVPYQSDAQLMVQKEGAKEGDMVFLLGFPGSTMRYAPTSRLKYSDDVAVPNMVRDFARKLELLAQFKTDSSEAALKLGKSEKSLANEYKRSKGKLVMMRKLGLLRERSLEEDELCKKASDARRVLDRLQEIYSSFETSNSISSALESCRGIYAGSALLATGHTLHEYLTIEKLKPDEERETSYRKRNQPFLWKRLGTRLNDIHIPHEAALIQDALKKLGDTSKLKPLSDKITNILKVTDNDNDNSNILNELVSSSSLKQLDGDSLPSSMSEDENNNNDMDWMKQDPFVQCADVLWETYKNERDTSKALLSERDELLAKLLELQRKHASEGETFYPDCNGSLRISAGHVEGYKAADAVQYEPSTTLAGLFDKATEAKLTNNNDDESNAFSCPDRLYQMLASEEDDISKVPVCMLYSTDTVGGNSGSPVMNADGELVGINFDRQRQGLMNEFKWSKDYSRSIATDIRYMLWLIGTYDSANHLVDEMLEVEK
eukprot:CAMPEP_0194143502 /NCGR_PEP_ID=MMETSP0152-20130528/12674_1 /TAXON_ID=1049557 /ORGANISM="Thalassiothrix antarctica, Strain L6-D1" /LENGTH=736 /DNA_ID=CAMNT_0038842953 /DNA_START=69 /DNA_END=2279 /DNA_ORIENTATION=-